HQAPRREGRQDRRGEANGAKSIMVPDKEADYEHASARWYRGPRAKVRSSAPGEKTRDRDDLIRVLIKDDARTRGSEHAHGAGVLAEHRGQIPHSPYELFCRGTKPADRVRRKLLSYK